ncbi:DASH complex subunit ask1 [Lobosporangium transversale]|nr:DASH complex subunit ask1 [Lobosporangium transversale]
MSFKPPSTQEVLDEIERLDQAITRTMQEIDESFSKSQMTVSTKIIPQVERYAESSRKTRDVTQYWHRFFQATLTPRKPIGRHRNRTAKEASNKQHSTIEAENSRVSQGAQERVDLPHTFDISNHDHDDVNQDETSTNRQRIDEIDLSSSRLSPGFLGSSSLGSMPSTPTPIRSNHKISRLQLGADARPSSGILWPQHENHNSSRTTPIRMTRQNERTAEEPASTIPAIIHSDRSMLLSTFNRAEPAPSKKQSDQSQANDTVLAPSKTQSNQTQIPATSSKDWESTEFNVDEDHQDVISSPTTLHTSIPGSKPAVTPHSAVAKSRVDRVQMKDGLGIPQPLLVNNDDDDDAAILEKYSEVAPSRDLGINGSKKRSRGEDFIEPLEDTVDAQSKNWASLTDKQRDNERLFVSPRKMANVKGFFAPSSRSQSNLSGAPHQEQESDNEERSHSPTHRSISQHQSQGDFVDEDPLLKALQTPPEIRKAMQRIKARDSFISKQPASSSSLSLLFSKASDVFTDKPSLVRSSSGTGSRQPSTSTSSAAQPASLLTTAPTSTTAAEGISASTISSDIGAAFLESFNSAFAATSNRRQTVATPIGSSKTQIRRDILGTGQSSGSSMGSSPPSFMTPSPLARLGRFSLVDSSRRSVHSIVPSPATQAAASAIASAAAATSSSSDKDQIDRSHRPTGQTSSGDESGFASNVLSSGSNVDSMPIPAFNGSNILEQEQDEDRLLLDMIAGSGEQQSFPETSFSSSQGFRTPASNRNPPPAPRLGYYSDTMTTQSSLGLNHDG